MDFLLNGFKALAEHPEMIAMWAIGGLLIYLAIKKDMEPALLLPMGFGAILVNLPLSPVIQEHGITLRFSTSVLRQAKPCPCSCFRFNYYFGKNHGVCH